MKRTRVPLLDMRPRLRQIVADALAREPDLEIVPAESLKSDPIARLGIDVVIIGTQNPDDNVAPTEVLAVLPHSRVLMVATSGRRAVMYELRPEKLALGEVSAESLVHAIRQGPTDLWQPIGRGYTKQF